MDGFEGSWGSARAVLEEPIFPCTEAGSCPELEGSALHSLPSGASLAVDGRPTLAALPWALLPLSPRESGELPPPATGRCAHPQPPHPGQTRPTRRAQTCTSSRNSSTSPLQHTHTHTRTHTHTHTHCAPECSTVAGLETRA